MTTRDLKLFNVHLRNHLRDYYPNGISYMELRNLLLKWEQTPKWALKLKANGDLQITNMKSMHQDFTEEDYKESGLWKFLDQFKWHTAINPTIDGYSHSGIDPYKYEIILNYFYSKGYYDKERPVKFGHPILGNYLLWKR